jgi:hypothetical protein
VKKNSEGMQKEEVKEGGGEKGNHRRTGSSRGSRRGRGRKESNGE